MVICVYFTCNVASYQDCLCVCCLCACMENVCMWHRCMSVVRAYVWHMHCVRSHVCARRQEKNRGIKWSLRPLASMWAVCWFLRARAVFKIFLRAASTLENTDGEHQTLQKNTDGEQIALRVLRKFSASRNHSFINRIRCFAPSNS